MIKTCSGFWKKKKGADSYIILSQAFPAFRFLFTSGVADRPFSDLDSGAIILVGISKSDQAPCLSW